uniref:phenylalanine--tRNA ligase n=1 Tax=Sparus aurata TaxID=8175 RepID=A0A671Y6E1_SPAAU
KLAAHTPAAALTLLQRIEKVDDGVDSLEVASSLGVDHQVIVGAVKSLQALGDVISAELRSSKRWELTEEGTEIAEQGSHEARVFSSIPLEGLGQSELMKLSFGKIGFSKAMSNKWIRVDKAHEGGPRIFRTIEDQVREKLLLVKKGDMTQLEEKEKNELKKRKLLSEVTVKSYWISKGNSFSTTVTKQEAELTPEMIANGSWKEKKFKPYNFEALGVAPDCGHLHPLMKVRTQFRQIFLEMGFTEMPTNNFIESSFWNFDSLFQPQQHPARDQHDTFFLSDPALAHEFPQDYLERVKKVHSEGGFGSQGYKYDWKIEEAQKNILRTHTTAVSARMLYKLAQQEKFTPVKYFSIDRVFRNETLDATHLAEFHQIEGVVADYGLTLGDLMGILHQFFTKLGITKLRFKPAYNPYTEPSMEVFSYHEGLKKWVEVGNSGVFRPEMLLPMGLPEDVSVIAWGLSLERPTMIKYGINNIRELVGHKVNLQMVYDSPICRLES